MQGLVQKTQSFAQNVPNFCAKHARKTQNFAKKCKGFAFIKRKALRKIVL
jgi:hypothetical protein